MEPKAKLRATAIILDKDKIMLFRRIRQGMQYYIIPGGGVEEGETVEQGLMREVREELSLEVEDFEPLCVVDTPGFPDTIPGINRGRRVYHCFLIKKYSGTPELGGEEKASANEQNQYFIEWIPLSEVAKMKQINLYPHEAAEALLASLKERNLFK